MIKCGKYYSRHLLSYSLLGSTVFAPVDPGSPRSALQTHVPFTSGDVCGVVTNNQDASNMGGQTMR